MLGIATWSRRFLFPCALGDPAHGRKYEDGGRLVNHPGCVIGDWRVHALRVISALGKQVHSFVDFAEEPRCICEASCFRVGLLVGLHVTVGGFFCVED